MVVHIVEGNLLYSDCNVIAHQANCQGVMGAGIALQIAQKYPEVLEADLNYKHPIGSRDRMGRTSHAWVSNKKRLVINLYGQHRYGRNGKFTEEDMLEKALDSVFRRLDKMKSLSNVKFGLPYGIGAGLAKGDWNVIYPMIERLSKQYGRDVYLYKLK